MAKTRGRIDRDSVVAAALALADGDGLEALSMRTLADRLGVGAMALYRHVADKEDLLDALVEALLAEVEIPPPAADWRRDLRALAHSLRRTGHRHPAVFMLLMTRPVTSVAGHRPIEALLELLERAGLGPRSRVRVYHLASTYMLGFVLSELSGRFSPGTLPARERLARLPHDEFPAHHHVAKYLVEIDGSREFDAGLDLLIHTIATMGRRRSDRV